MDKNILIIMPSFNQENELIKLFKQNENLLENVLLVNDGSTDKTQSLVKQFNVNSITHKKRLGYGAAILSGLRFAIENDYEQIVTLDSDGAHHFSEIPAIVETHIYQKTDLTIGSRFLTAKNSCKYFPDAKINANIFATSIFNKVFNKNLTDVASGFRVITNRLIKLNFNSYDMGFTFELIIKAAKNNFSICEHGIKVRYNAELLFATNQSEILSFLNVINYYSEDITHTNKLLANLISMVESFSTIKIKIGHDYYILFPLKERGVYVFQHQNNFFVDSKDFLDIEKTDFV